MDQSAFLKRLFAIAGSGGCLLLILVWVSLKHGLSPRGFAVAVLIVWIAMFISVFRLIRSRQRSAEGYRKKQIASGIPAEVLDRDQCIKNIRTMKRLIVVFALLLGYGLLTTRGELMLPRTVGAAFDVFVLAVCVHSLIRSQKKLKGLPGDRSSESQR